MSKKEVHEASRAERQREHEDQLRINEELQRAAKESAQKVRVRVRVRGKQGVGAECHPPQPLPAPAP